MAITKQKKTEVLAKITDALASAASVVFVSFKNLTVSEANTLRKELGGSEVSYTVVKKTLLRKALQERGLAGEGELPGEIAIAYGGDLIAPARGIASFSKKTPDRLSIEGGVFDGALMTKEKMREIAAIPGLDTLRAQFVFMINSPLQRLAIALDQIAKKSGGAGA